MARCMKNEREGRRIFYGAMICCGRCLYDCGLGDIRVVADEKTSLNQLSEKIFIFVQP